MFQFQDYTLNFSGEVFNGMFLGSNRVADSKTLECKIERLLQNYEGSEDLTDHIVRGFQETESSEESEDNFDGTKSSDEETSFPCTSATVEQQKTRRKDYSNALQEIASNNQKCTVPPMSQDLADEDTASGVTLANVMKKLGKC